MTAPSDDSGLIRFDQPAGGPGRPARWSLLIVLAVLAVAFGSARLVHRPASPVSQPTEVALTAPAGASWPVTGNQVGIACSRAQLAELVAGFVRAFNAGDQQALQRSIAQPSQGFSSFGTIFGSGTQLVGRSQLAGYFAARHAQHEVITLGQLRYLGYSGQTASFQFGLTRQAADLSRTEYSGSGQAACHAGEPPTIANWLLANAATGS